MPSKTKLKPCPFCGKQASVWSRRLTGNYAKIKCLCGIIIFGKTLTEARRRWNTRHKEQGNAK